MKIRVGELGFMVLEEVYEGIVLQRPTEAIVICMRDEGFEFRYNGRWYEAKNGVVRLLDDSNN